MNNNNDNVLMELVRALTRGGSDTPEMRNICLHCKAPQEACDGACIRIMEMAKGNPDPGEAYAGVTKRKYRTENAQTVKELIAKTGYKKTYVYNMIEEGQTPEEIIARGTARKQFKELLTTLVEETGTNQQIIRRRLRAGWSPERIIKHYKGVA